MNIDKKNDKDEALKKDFRTGQYIYIAISISYEKKEFVAAFNLASCQLSYTLTRTLIHTSFKAIMRVFGKPP